MFNLENLFSKKINKDKTSDEVKPEVSDNQEILANSEEAPKKIDPMEGLNLTEKLTELEKQKINVEALQKKRVDYYVEAKGLEEKMASLGLSDEQKKNIHEQIMTEGGKISDEIAKIREDYGFEPTPIEVYGARIEMLKGEQERIKEGLNTKYREILKFLKDNYFGSVNESDPRTYQTLEYLEQKFGNFPEVKKTLNKIKDNNYTTIEPDINELIEIVNKKIEENSFYKTPAEIDGAYRRLDKLTELISTNEFNQIDAKNGTGRFAEENKENE